MADIFVSYTSSDRDWAFWIGHELIALGHRPRIHEWEIPGGGDIPKWMEERHHDADSVLCVISKAYLEADYSSWERRSAQWAAQNKRPNFLLPVAVEACEVPTLLAHVKRCSLHGLSEDEARTKLAAFLAPAEPTARPTVFPGAAKSRVPAAHSAAPFPGKPAAAVALSNIPIAVPRHFLGRDESLAAIDAALAGNSGRVAVTALHGLRGVGKTTLAVAYAERHRENYRATWWIRAESESGMRADLVALGVRLGWVAADEKEEPALNAALGKLRDDGAGILLIYDNAFDSKTLKPYLPRSGASRVLITSNAPAWRGLAEPLEIDVWPKEVGADYLIARTGRAAEREAAEALSEALGGLPLAHEQAAAYCEDLGVALADYRRRFEGEAGKFLDDAEYAPEEYHNRRTVAATFSLAIDEAARRHPAAEPLLVHAALLAPEPIPLYLFSEAREKFGEPLASGLSGDGLDKAVAALRTFALVDRETITDERDPAITTDCIRLHRLVRQVAAARCVGDEREGIRGTLINALAAVYPFGVYNDPGSWPQARRLDAHALALIKDDVALPDVAKPASELLNELGAYRQFALGAYSLARRFYERALAIREKAFGAEHPSTATSLNNLALLLLHQGDLIAPRPLFERALAIHEKTLGPEHRETGADVNNLALLLQGQGDLAGARPLFERALAISEKVLGSENPDTAICLNNLAGLLRDQGDFAGARPLYERALMIDVTALGPEHPSTNVHRANLARWLIAAGDAENGLKSANAALAAHEKTLGSNHPWTTASASVTADALDALGRAEEAAKLRARYGLTKESPPSAPPAVG
ncbi:MAG: tetratricopeptide repeat protein [Propylenella sp.]